MHTLTAHLTCPACGGELTESEPVIHAPDHGQIDGRCTDCLGVWRIDITMTMVDAWPADRSRQARQDRARARAGTR